MNRRLQRRIRAARARELAADHSIKEIAEILGVHPGTVYQLLDDEKAERQRERSRQWKRQARQNDPAFRERERQRRHLAKQHRSAEGQPGPRALSDRQRPEAEEEGAIAA